MDDVTPASLSSTSGQSANSSYGNALTSATEDPVKNDMVASDVTPISKEVAAITAATTETTTVAAVTADTVDAYSNLNLNDASFSSSIGAPSTTQLISVPSDVNGDHGQDSGGQDKTDDDDDDDN